MKIINFSLIFFVLALVILIIYNLISFGSAFEADQQCHYDLIEMFDGSEQAGCDHDTETNQWILFKKQSDSLPAKVVKRYRY